jgi:methionine aminopeptidase
MARELGIGVITLTDILKELEKPARDPREDMPAPILRSDVLDMKDLKPGMIFTVEPMLNAGRRQISELNDGWTVVTADRSLSAQWEHTVLVTETGYEVLTLSDGYPPIPDYIKR